VIIDLKYHIASLVAVFLALGVGIFIGSTILGNDTIIRQQEQLTKRLESQLEDLRQKTVATEARASKLENNNSIQEQFEKQLLPVLIQDKLLGVQVAIVVTSDYGLPEDLKSVLEMAGAKVDSVTTVLNNFNDEIDKLTGFKTKSMLCMPLTNNKDKIIGVFQLLNSKFNKFTYDDEDFLKALSSHASIALENVKLHQKILLQQIFENEMQIASDIQRKLLPKENPNLIDYSLSGINIPSKYISGDYFDFIEDYEGNLICIVADVTGKGVAAALRSEERRVGKECRSRWSPYH